MNALLFVLAPLLLLLVVDRLVVRGRFSGRRDDGESDYALSMQAPERENARGFSLGCIMFHFTGFALVLNSLITYATLLVLFNLCTSPSEATCLDSYGQKEHFLSLLVAIGYINLALRFMAGGGFLLDLLAVLYVLSSLIKVFLYGLGKVYRVLGR